VPDGECTWQRTSHLNRTTNGHGRPRLGLGALGTTTFALGLLTGLVLNGAVRQLYQRARRGLQHRESGGTVVYEENLPPSLSRRESVPQLGQPRFGGTGALGVSPRAVDGTLGRVEQQ
jgi:hypothetical protein